MIKIIKKTGKLDGYIKEGNKRVMAEKKYYGEFLNVGFLESNGCIDALLTEFNVFLKHDHPVKRYQIIDLKEWFNGSNGTLLDTLRAYAQANHLELSDLIGTSGELTVITEKDENDQEASVITEYIPEFDEEMVVCA